MIHVINACVAQEGYSAVQRAMDTLCECFERIRNTLALIACRTWEQLHLKGWIWTLSSIAIRAF
jgi:hypothetical protein